MTITPSPAITTPEASPLSPLKPTVRTFTTDGTTFATTSGVLARRCGGRRGRRRRVTVTVCVMAVCVLLPQPTTARPSAHSEERQAPHGSRWLHRRASRTGRQREQRRQPDEHEAQLAPLLLVAEARGEILVDGVQLRLVLGREELAARRLRDLAQRRRVGRHRAREAAAGDHPVRRAERDRVDGDAVRLRTGRAVERGEHPARLGAVREQQDRRERLFGSAGGRRRRRPGSPCRRPTRLEQRDRARERVADRRALARDVVVLERLQHQLAVRVRGAATYDSTANVTSPTRYFFGRSLRKRRIAPSAAPRRVGFTSSAAIEPDMSTASAIEACSLATETFASGRRERASAQVSASSDDHRRDDRCASASERHDDRPAPRCSCSGSRSARAASRSRGRRTRRAAPAGARAARCGQSSLIARTPPGPAPRRVCRPGARAASRSRGSASRCARGRRGRPRAAPSSARRAV